MAAAHGITGSVASWANNTFLIASGAADASFTASLVSTLDESTPFSPLNNTATGLPGFKSFTGTITSVIDTAILGTGGGVTATAPNYLVTGSRKWTLTLTRGAVEHIAFPGLTGPYYREYLPTIMRWGGTFEGVLDDTNPAVEPADPNDSPNLADLTLTIATGKTFTGKAHLTEFAPAVDPNEINTFSCQFAGSSTLTALGSFLFQSATSTPIVPSLDPSGDALVLVATGLRTYTIDAFWTRITINCALDEVVTADIDFQGTGPLTIG